MPSSALYLQFMYASQAIISCWGAFQSVNAVTNLQKYEKTSEKLAEWSDTAKEHLHKTRTTQTTGALTVHLPPPSPQTPQAHVLTAEPIKQVLASLITSLTLAIGSPYLPAWFRLSASPALLVAVLLARRHIKQYWNPKDLPSGGGVRLPLPNMEGYNEAQRRTDELLQTLEYLEYGWVGTSLVAGMLLGGSAGS
ncbi:hypothetical protein LTR91_025353 [Friedmanniomyces endolithicus]|uniref:Uncharacterized protein n=1 Tax=Friedmanniomyces endolithicus TaxID=329885 RepID=A0AAN6H016_9PEZI|nr:hypothetical protein LTR94_010230 [Friedmanniomyces endolithicus]KAK0773851.1 hypothetical protein LTR38_016429 [Friedmanniomyces endolithicus]KAK0792966.1 hypothetical protein LTR59_008338 [Friedmanniomyces endolithicus]KAK0837568.1 hypothetical protein LTR03_012682 [Friedmanniomyces endolithicus]KAK0853475.1 hypothetical protein LTS02_011905 [Friedmanniomyces endolithicus]